MKPPFPTFRRLVSQGPPFASLWPRRTTSVQRKGLLRLIAIASEERLPLVPLLEAWAEDERGVQRHRLQRLLKILKGGTALPDAVEQVPRTLGDDYVLTVRFGCQSGTLAPAIRDVLDEPDLFTSRATTDLRKSLFYLGLIVAVSLPLVAFLRTKIVPAFLQIFDDLDLEVAIAMRQSQLLLGIAMDYWWLGTAAILLTMGLIFSSRSGRYLRRSILGKFFRPLRTWRTADVMQKLSTAARAGRPMPGVLSTLARYHFDPSLRRKLLYVRNEVEQGEDLWHSMAAVKLLTLPEVAVLETAERVGNRAWVLKQLGRVKKRRTMDQLESMSALLLPLLVMLFAALVLFQSLAVFGTLLQLTTALM
ncbi:MAG: type II secretion system F family protein [Pirellulales bacterium]